MEGRIWPEHNHGRVLVLYPVVMLIRQELKNEMIIATRKVAEHAELLLGKANKIGFQLNPVRLAIAP